MPVCPAPKAYASHIMTRVRGVGERSILGVVLALAACDDGAGQDGEDPPVGAPASDSLAELGLGAEGPEVAEAHAYLRQYGYFPNPELALHYPGWTPVVDVGPDDPELFDLTLEEALSMFQQTHGLPVTGLLDGPTRTLMQQPRCGMPDNYAPPRPGLGEGDRRGPAVAGAPVPIHGAPESIDDLAHMHDPSAYVPSGSSWAYTELGYGFTTATSDIGVDFQRQAVVAAMNTWSAVAPIAWAERPNPDVAVAFLPNVHGDNKFGNAYAHAFYPSCNIGNGPFNCTGTSGDVHFNDQTYTWGTGNGGSVQDIQTVALHELGHSLGLDHSSDPSAVMYATAAYGKVQRSLTQDDISGIQSIYPTYRDLRSFAASWYLKLNEDLAGVYGGNLNAASFHWINYGRTEGRRASPAFDVKYYLKKNIDVAQAVGANNYAAALWHWRDYGLTEGRRASQAFDAKYYLNRYADLQGVFGPTNYNAALDHWLQSGLGEGRVASNMFDPKYYLQANPDVAQAYGATNYAGGLTHWLLYGLAEGRKATP